MKEHIFNYTDKGPQSEINAARKNHLNIFSEIIFIILGVSIFGFALKGFLIPNHFSAGGFTGIALLIYGIYHINFAFVIIAIRIAVIASIFVNSRRSAVKTFIALFLLVICLYWVPYPVITPDKLLVSLFGGFFMGLGMGLALRGGYATDGIEVLVLYVFRRTRFTVNEIIFGLNVIFFGIAAFYYGIENSLYSMLPYLIAAKTISYVLKFNEKRNKEAYLNSL